VQLLPKFDGVPLIRWCPPHAVDMPMTWRLQLLRPNFDDVSLIRWRPPHAVDMPMQASVVDGLLSVVPKLSLICFWSIVRLLSDWCYLGGNLNSTMQD
jgi:hypothetical protein